MKSYTDGRMLDSLRDRRSSFIDEYEGAKCPHRRDKRFTWFSNYGLSYM